jgi:hypothetical protein
MTNIHVIRYTTRPDAVAENARLAGAVYDELATRQPADLRYATLLLPEEHAFLHVVAGTDGILPELAAFQEFQRDLAARVLTAPRRVAATLVGRYRLG